MKTKTKKTESKEKHHENEALHKPDELKTRGELLADASRKPIRWVFQMQAEWEPGFYATGCEWKREFRGTGGIRVHISPGYDPIEVVDRLRRFADVIQADPEILNCYADDEDSPTLDDAKAALLDAVLQMRRPSYGPAALDDAKAALLDAVNELDHLSEDDTPF